MKFDLLIINSYVIVKFFTLSEIKNLHERLQAISLSCLADRMNTQNDSFQYIDSKNYSSINLNAKFQQISIENTQSESYSREISWQHSYYYTQTSSALSNLNTQTSLASLNSNTQTLSILSNLNTQTSSASSNSNTQTSSVSSNSNTQTLSVSSKDLNASRTYWDTNMNIVLLNNLENAQRENLDTNNDNFKSTNWKLTITLVKTMIRQSINRNICDNRWKHFKKTWKLWRKHLSQISDWTWDDNLETIVSTIKIMNTYFAKHSDMIQFRNANSKYWICLEKILRDRIVSENHEMRVKSFSTDTDQQKKNENSELNDDEINEIVNFSITNTVTEMKNFSISIIAT